MVYRVSEGKTQSLKTTPEREKHEMTKTAKRSIPRWSPEDVQLLTSNVQNAATAKEGIQATAKALGKSEGTVSAKWYGLKKQGFATSTTGKKRGRPVGSKNRAKAPVVRSQPRSATGGIVALARQLEAARAEVSRLESQLRAAV